MPVEAFCNRIRADGEQVNIALITAIMAKLYFTVFRSLRFPITLDVSFRKIRFRAAKIVGFSLQSPFTGCSSTFVLGAEVRHRRIATFVEYSEDFCALPRSRTAEQH